MAQTYYSPFIPAFSSSGAPVPGALLYFYTTQTNVLAPIYADVSLTTLLKNPVQADLAGRYPDIYLEDDIVYRVKQTTSDDQPLGNDIDPYVPGQALRGVKGDTGADALTLAWTKTYLNVPANQTVFTTDKDIYSNVVTVILNTGELTAGVDFTVTGVREITLAHPPTATSNVVVIKAFDTPSGSSTSIAIITPEMFGAVGNGSLNTAGALVVTPPNVSVHDDTLAWQAAVDASAAVGGIVLGRKGVIYGINGNANAPFGIYGGVNLRTNSNIDLNGCTLALFANNQPGYSVFVGYKVGNFKLDGGELRGDRQEHTGTNGEFGHCLTLFACYGFTLGAAMRYSRAWGDGICLLASYTTNANGSFTSNGDFNTNFVIQTGYEITNCRRNGISVVAARNAHIGRGIITAINGTAPMAAIDFEPDHAEYPNMNITFDVPICSDVQIGVVFTVGNQNVVGFGGNQNAHNTAILFVAGCVDCWIFGGNHKGGETSAYEGGAVRAVGGNAVRCGVRGANLSGGGFFVIETLGGDDVSINQNNIYVTTAGCYGPARMLGNSGCFVDNFCEMEAGTGNASVQHLQLYCREFGRNRYYNKSSIQPANALLSGTDLGGDYYGNGLKRPNGKTGGAGGIVIANEHIPAVGGSGVGANSSVTFDINVDCLNNILTFVAFGNGENGADKTAVIAVPTYQGADKATIQITNKAGAAQTVGLNYNVTTKV